jgi:hypothetical protein
MEGLGMKEGWVVLFDQRKTVGWEEKVFEKTEQREGRTIHVLGC